MRRTAFLRNLCAALALSQACGQENRHLRSLPREQFQPKPQAVVDAAYFPAWQPEETRGANTNGKYVVRGGDTLFDRSEVDQGTAIFQHDMGGERRTQVSTDKRKLFWELFANLDSCKTQTPMWSAASGRPTLEYVKYIVLPIWWDGEPINSATTMSKSDIQTGLDQIAQQYAQMSFNKHTLEFELWDQTVLAGVTPTNADFGNSETAAAQYVAAQGRVQFQDYTSILLVYNGAQQGPFSGAGGWAGVNSYFAWTTYFGASIRATFEVVRHEIGHNYGHPHHLANTYSWRITDGGEFDPAVYDGWDMMSGGNGYDRSDLSAASKWHFNWISDDAIVTLQPEGATPECPECLASVNGLVLRPFDDETVTPSASNKMAVHVPIMANNGAIYSYWFSYRGNGNDGLAANGLSIHLSWFQVCNGMFGSSYDSTNYDAYGDTADDTSDAFVSAGTCYVVKPSVLTMKIDFGAVDQVQPVVCVDDLSPGSSIKISAFFLDPSSPPANTVGVPASEQELGCSKGGTSSGNLQFDLSGGKNHLLHYTGSGIGGTINARMCLQTGTSATAYFYDSYPHSSLAFGSPPGYGAYKSLPLLSGCSSINYRTAHGETFVVIEGGSSATVSFDSTCKLDQCHGSQYLEGGICKQCPEGSVSPLGSTSPSDCVPCAEFGAVAPHPKASECVFPTDFDSSITSGTGWRLITDREFISDGWKWDVTLLEFFSSPDCTSGKVDPATGTPTESGNAGGGWGASNALFGSGTWGGRSTSDGVYWIGLEFPQEVTVKCVALSQPHSDAIASRLFVQARQSASNGAIVWQNVWLAENLLASNSNTIMIADDGPPPPPPDPVCGNNIQEGAEVCDGTDSGGTTCADFGPEGYLAVPSSIGCLPGCSEFDRTPCHFIRRETTDLAAEAGLENRGTISIDYDIDWIKFEIFGGSGDADLYVRFGSPPTTEEYDDCRPWLSGNSEECHPNGSADSSTLVTAQKGIYHYMVHAYSTYAGVTLRIITDGVQDPASVIDPPTPPPPPPEVCGNNIQEGAEVCDGTDTGTTACADFQVEGYLPVPSAVACLTGCSGFDKTPCQFVRLDATGLAAGQPGDEYKGTITVNSGINWIKFELSGGTGDADLYVRFGAPPTLEEYDDCRPYLSGNNEECNRDGSVDDNNMVAPQVGVYHYMIHAYSAFSGVTLRVTTDGVQDPATAIIDPPPQPPSPPTTVEPRGTSWRLTTHKDNLPKKFKWNIDSIEFFASPDCLSGKIDTSTGTPFESRHAGDFGPSNAFVSAGRWKGRHTNNVFWIGMEFPQPVTIGCVTLLQKGINAFASQLAVQVQKTPGAAWEDVWQATNLVSTSVNEISALPKSTAWRLFTQRDNLPQKWKWDVEMIEFFSSSDCVSGKIDTSTGAAFDSGNAGAPSYEASNAFDDTGIWGGRDSNNAFWIGMDFSPQQVRVACVTLNQPSADGAASRVIVQSQSSGGNWQDSWVVSNLVSTNVNTMPLP